VLNKSDKQGVLTKETVGEFAHCVEISALTGAGMDDLRAAIEGLFVSGEIDYDTTPVLTGAHRHAMIHTAIACLEKAKEAVGVGLSPDVAALDLEMAAGELGRLDGRGVSEEVVDGIFSRFCVGK
jgi:tRNA modification GTPase